MSEPGPDPVDPAFLDRAMAEMSDRARRAEPLSSAHRGSAADVAKRVSGTVESMTDDLLRVSHALAADPEVGFEEVRSSALLAEVARAYGVEVTHGVADLPTALRAETGPARGPTVAVMSEYDALPEIGHACGHNVIASAGLGAFLALAALGDDLPGRVVWLGTPAEEGGAGKELMARAGQLDGIDAALMVHPFGFDVAEHVFLGRRIARVTFTGATAHASAQPFMGRNALDAVSLTYQGIGLYRQQMPPSDRIHGVVTAGGRAPNVIPDRGELFCYVRSPYPDMLRTLSHRLEQIARGAALMTGCGVQVEWDELPATLPLRSNTVLAGRWGDRLAERGRTVLPRGVVPELLAGSTDFGNVSYRVPSLHPMIQVADPNVSLHTREFAAAAVSPAGDAAVLDGAIGLALVALDYLSDADLRAAADAEFAAELRIDVPTYFEG